MADWVVERGSRSENQDIATILQVV